MARSDDMAGEKFGKYVVVRRLAMGGMAEVCLARLEGAAGFEKLVVVKQVLPGFAEDPAFIDMFLDEGRLAARLTHPNIAQTFELGQERGRYFMAMEYVTGRSLAAIFDCLAEKDEQLPLACALRVTMQLLEALSYAHSVKDARGKSLNLVHRDVSPSNVMVTWDGSVKLLDFGIAKAAAQVHQTRAGRVKGKAGYMSPEQCRGKELDARSDLYSTGALLYQMATGRRPFEELMAGGADPIAVMQATLKGGFAKPSELEPSLPGAVDDIVLKAMALKADDRYPNAGAMLRDLERFATAMGIFPSAQKLVDLMSALFPGEGEQDAQVPAPPPPLPKPPERLQERVTDKAHEKPGPPVPTQPELKRVVSLEFAGTVPRADAAPGESGVQTKVRDAAPGDSISTLGPVPVADGDGEPRTTESLVSAETEYSTGLGEPVSEPEIPTELSGPKVVRRPRPPVAMLALVFGGAIVLGLLAVALLAPAEVPQAPRRTTSTRAAAPAPDDDPSESDTGTVSLDANPPAKVSWGETDFGETPVVLAVPTGEQTFVFRWDGQPARKVRLVVPAAETVTHVETLAP